MTSLRDEPCVEARMDTWRNWSYAAAWRWLPRSRPNSDAATDLNSWGAIQLEELFLALHSSMRVRELAIDGRPGTPPLHGRKRIWSGARPHAIFERTLIESLRSAPAAVTDVDFEFDLHVWVRTASSPTVPVRGWVCASASASMVFEGANPYGALKLDHTLFIDGQLHGDSNHELHRLNQPLLREALAQIEARLGPITEAEGLLGVSRTGFDSVG